MIAGVELHPLRRIPDERGRIMHMLRADAPHFRGFGEIYFSVVREGAIKAWHIHTKMWLNYACVSGMIKFVLHDDREDSPTKGETQEIFLGNDNYQLVVVPPLVWNGFKGISPGEAIVANCASIPHDPTEIARLDPFSPKIPYDWSLRHG